MYTPHRIMIFLEPYCRVVALLQNRCELLLGFKLAMHDTKL